MDPPTTSLYSSSPDDMDAPQPSFAATWDSPVAAHLAPSNLPLNKVQRAWDRRPQSPFSRKKVRFGKVWKRNNTPSADATSMFGGASMIHAIGGESPGKAVKKMRVDYGEVVRDWDGKGSPGNRRIVTRSNQSEELIALDEEESQEQDAQEVLEVEEEVLRVEVENEDGTIQEISAGEELQQDDWEDESVTEEDVWDATLMHLGEAVYGSPAKRHSGILQDEPEQIEADPHADEPAADVQDAVEQDDEQEVSIPDQLDVDLATVAAIEEPQVALLERPSLPLQAPVLPAGFVSPIKERRRRPISQVKQAQANRRRTLPVNFAAVQAATVKAPETQIEAEAEGRESHDYQSPVEEAPEAEQAMADEHVQEAPAANYTVPAEDMSVGVQESEGMPHDEDTNDNEWEDVEDEDLPVSAAAIRNLTPDPAEPTEWVDTVENTPTTSPAKGPVPDQSLAEQVHERVANLLSPSKLPSSPVPSITGQHPRLPLRRSPRRQSTSPLKKSNILPSDRSHLIAFTPVKLQIYQSTIPDAKFASSPLPTSPVFPQGGISPPTGMPQITRSSSAPPEEPQMSPRKPGQPRLSDDTALLQAFINKASESKNSRRISATARRESLENRRNSDTVRQALASPAVKPVDVLGDLDPNSPSPRKQAAVEAVPKHAQSDDQDELSQSPPAKAASRRSGRAKKKPETLPASTYSGPNKISIRGSADSVVLKKTEAQELAQATRTNTKKNKGGAVLPPLRLTRMAKEAALNNGEATEVDMEVDPNRRGITWAETLATFYQGAEEPEISMMIDELSGPEPETEEPSRPDVDMAEVPTPTPASATPSKPRQRRLMPARTASTPAKPAQSVQSESAEPAKETKPKATTRKRSRIATPAKPKGGTVVAEPIKEAVREEASKAPAAKKKAVSKLPAPSASAIAAAQGKENSVIVSPPKKAKAPATTSATSKTMPPKLDFTKSVGLDKKHTTTAPPGIASPAKRSARTNVLFGEDGSVTKKELPPSLGSPAKKRTRRTAA